jgi:hypothetical protein
MNQTATTPQTAWQFEVSSGEGGAGTLTVERGTGRWANTINTETGTVGSKGVHAYDAHFIGTDGVTQPLTITRNDLLWLRRHAKRPAAESEA